LNDLEDFLENHNVTGLLTISQDIENIMNVYMNIFVLLYADDTVLMAETPEIQFGVEDLRFSRSLQYFKCTLSIISQLLNPHNSQP
jgi:hypothetical protein